MHRKLIRFGWMYLIWCIVAGMWPAFAQSNLKVAKINFSGNSEIPAKELKSILKSREKKTFNARFVKLDRILITNYYQLRGYLNVYADYDIQKDGDRVNINFTINEGRRYYLKEIAFEGNEKFSAPDLRSRIGLKNGEPYQRSEIDKGINAIEALYTNDGKPYVVINTREETVADSLIQLAVQIDEGITVRIVDLRIEGTEQVKRYLIRREMTFDKGDLFSRTKIENSQRNIYSTGLFKFVNYRLEPDKNDPSAVTIFWQVSEKKPAWLGFRFGVGNEQDDTRGSITTFDFTAEGGHRNIAGNGHSISLQVVPSLFYGREKPDQPRKFLNPRNEYTFTFVEPWVLNTRTPGIFKLSFTRERPPITNLPLNSLTASFNINHNFEGYWSYSAGISFQKVDLQENTDISALSSSEVNNLIAGGQDLIYALTFFPVKDKRDNYFTPNRGYLTEYYNKIAYTRSRPIIAGSAQDTLVTNLFYKFNVQWSRYQKFFLKPQWVLATRVRGAGLIEFREPRPIAFIPQSERFFLGGANSVRGYQERFIGEILEYQNTSGDIQREPLGGKYLFLANAELRIPLFWLFMGEVFVDAGNIFQEFGDIRNFSLKMGTGLGLAIITPFGPVRFDYGWKLFPEKNEAAGNFHIGISFAF